MNQCCIIQEQIYVKFNKIAKIFIEEYMFGNGGHFVLTSMF